MRYFRWGLCDVVKDWYVGLEWSRLLKKSVVESIRLYVRSLCYADLGRLMRPFCCGMRALGSFKSLRNGVVKGLVGSERLGFCQRVMEAVVLMNFY